MKVILQQDIKGTGKSGEVINVSEGYGRNFLLPRGLAKAADAANMTVYKQKQSAEAHRKQIEREEAQKTASKINGKTVKIIAKTGDNGKLFGSVTTKEIAEALSTMGHSVDKKKIDLKDPIRTLGDVVVEVKIYSGISAKLTVSVVDQ